MSEEERPRDTDAVTPASDRSPGLDQLVSGPEREPLDSERDGDYRHNHVALLYADQTEQFDAVMPFLREGLERNDRCVYIADDNEVAAVEAAMRDAGIDVDAAVESGALSLHATADTFLRTGRFDPDDMRTFAIETIRAATEDDGYDRLRVTGEMTWVLENDHSIESMVEYEHMLNSVFGERDVVGICQYNVERFDAAVLNQVLHSHPEVVYGGSASRDFYYLPPETFGGETAVSDDGTEDVHSFLDRVRALETLEQRERSLRALNEATQELMYLDSEAVARRAADILRDVLEVPYASFWGYDETTGELERRASSVADDGVSIPPAEHLSDRAWDAFVTERPDVFAESVPTGDAGGAGTTLRSGVVVPVGRHGVLCAGSPRSDSFGDADVDVATTVGANVEAALDRADRERTLETKNDQLERLNGINRVIRGIDEALVDADTREDVERLVCERLAAADPYEFVWIGERDVASEVVTARARAGDGNGYLEDVTITTDDAPTGEGPVSTALATREVQVVQDVLTDDAFAPWRETTLAHGFRGCISVPLVYEESCYGVLTLYTDAPNAFDDLERTVLAELGGTIAHAIDAAETKRTLRADSVTELTLEIRAPDEPLCALARSVGARLEFDGLVPGRDGDAQAYVTFHDATPEDLPDVADGVAGVADLELVRTVADDDGATVSVEATVTEPTVAARVVDQQSLVRSLTVEDDVVTVVADLPPGVDVRTFVESVRAVYPETELLKRRTRDRPVTTRQDLRDAIEDRLTDRQREVLETAYLSGFFESPRARTGSELAESMDISQSTFAHHLRAAERRLCELVFSNA